MESAPLFASPKRNNGFYLDPSLISGSPPIKDLSMYPWNWGCGAQKITLSPAPSGNFGSGTDQHDDVLKSPDSERKRGRPRADSITSLILEGTQVDNAIRCRICSRVFPREKSLQAHMRTHTGERPYICDFPGCAKAFCQSGQMKTHQRLHTGEKPFKCSAYDCENRFTHANRHCALHPSAILHREPVDSTVSEHTRKVGNSPEVAEWFSRQATRRHVRTPYKGGSVTKRKLSDPSDTENIDAVAKRPAPRKRLLPPSDEACKEDSPEAPLAAIMNFQLLKPQENLPVEEANIQVENSDRFQGALALVQLAQGCS